ncbi:MAG: cell wall hydrolase [Bacillota bacterium]|jgi:N-acetylmuramoyl-L-alanine amidase|nr:spore cortex-lytic protein [Bacillota bacterium]
MRRTKLVIALVTLCAAGAMLLLAFRGEGDAQVRGGQVDLLARVVAAEAEGEPYQGQVAVAAVIMNRVKSRQFPNTLSGVVFQPHAFESVTNGLIWRRSPSSAAYAAARDAINGYDPTYGCLFFWNPSKPVSGWIWSRQIAVRIGSHVFAR